MSSLKPGDRPWRLVLEGAANVGCVGQLREGLEKAGNKCLCCLRVALRSVRLWEVCEHACFLESLKHLLDPG